MKGRETLPGISAGASILPVAIVIPTIGRPSLDALLASLRESADQTGISVPPVYVVDDRPLDTAPLTLAELTADGSPVVHRSGGRGPAAARNLGWRAAVAEWIVFLDDDVLVTPSWLAALASDIAQVPADVVGCQGRIVVPLPTDRRPTDWERSTAGLTTASWITADMAYRRSALLRTGGFDERFPRAFREDSDLALRMMSAGDRLEVGGRETVHPVRPAGWWVSVRQQRGNADDVTMRVLHGKGWRRRAAAPAGRLTAHLVSTAFAALGVVGLGLRRSRLARTGLLGWVLMMAEFAWRRIQPGPRDRSEVLKMILTSAVIPAAAVTARACAEWSARTIGRAGQQEHQFAAVLVDRDNTIIKDVPYNAEPALVVPIPGAKAALDRLRAAGFPIAVVSNQSGVARGVMTVEQLASVNARVEDLLGPFDAWCVCVHAEDDGCDCRKPNPGLVLSAARLLGVDPAGCVMIGDIGSDVAAAHAAGARSILVPTAQTLPQEVASARCVAPSLGAAAELILGGWVS